MLKNHLLRLLKKVQMQGARRNPPRKRDVPRAEAYMEVRWSERVEHNAADGLFSATC
jgi:hypothetical protein